MKLYRGYNKDYPNWGMREGQNHIWTTNDLDYAIMYANEFDNGGVVEFEIDDSKVKYANEYDYEEILGDEFGADPIDADNYACQQIINAGYNVLWFDTSDYDVYLLLDRDLIISAREINYNQEINEVLKNAGIQIEESWTDSYDLYDIYENNQPYNVLMSFVEGEQNIWFPLIKPTEYKQALLEFMKMGELVRFPKDKVFKWLEIIMKNTCIIDAMTALAGHTQWFPYDDCRDVYNELEDAETDYYIFSNFLDERGFYDWCKLPDGSDAWSDYGLQPLWDILDEYQENMTAEQVLVLVNRCLDVTHQRGDLPSAFIEGGSSSLTKISNESVERKISKEKDMDWKEFVNKIGRENEINDSIIIKKHNTTIVIRKNGNILIRVGLNPFKKAYSKLKSFNEIYNMLIKKGYIEKSNLSESISFEPTDDYFAIGGKVFAEEDEDCEVYNIYNDGIHIGMLAIEEDEDTIVLEGLEIFKKYRRQGFGKKVVDLLKKKHKRIYVRAIPSAKKFWQKQGHQAYHNKDTGTWDGDLIYESIKLVNKDYLDTRLITTPQELNAYLQNNTESRVIYDVEKKWYLVGNSETSIHYDMLRDAMVDGLYTMNDGFGRMMDGTKYEDGQNYYREHKDDFVIFRTTSDINNDEDFIYDDYRYSYEYKDYCVFDRNNDFPQTTLYQILGKPITVNYFGSEEDELDESIVQMDYSDEFGGVVYPKIILKNPTKKELRDFKDVNQWRVMKHKDGSWYFFVGYIHYELPISDILDVNGIFYHSKENTFYIRYGNDEVDSYFDENDSVDEIKGYLYNDEYIMNTFTNLKVKLITTSVPLEESIDYDDLYETPISDEEYDNLKIGDKVVYDDNNSKMVQPSKYDSIVDKDDDTITTQTRHHSGRARTNVKWNKNHFKRKFSLKESLSFEPTDEYFAIGGKEFHEEGSDVYDIMYDGINIGKLAITEYPDGISLDGLEIYKRFRKKGFGRNVVQKLKDKYKGIYVRALPSAKKFWEKQGHKAYYNKDTRTYDGDLINEELIHAENSYYGDHTSVILKNPTLNELKDYELLEARFICYGDVWLFFDATQWIHEQIIKKYPQYEAIDMGFYDFKKKTFFFVKSFDVEDDESQEFFVEKKMKELKLHRWLLTQPYIAQNFKNFKVEVMGDWNDSPW